MEPARKPRVHRLEVIVSLEVGVLACQLFADGASRLILALSIDDNLGISRVVPSMIGAGVPEDLANDMFQQAILDGFFKAMREQMPRRIRPKLVEVD